jgi:hypothetical protein
MVDNVNINISSDVDADIPHFVRVRGCVNCDVSKMMKKKAGNEHGFDIELAATCVDICDARGCANYGYVLSDPFIDPKDVISIARVSRKDFMMKNAKMYCLTIKEMFGKFYDKLGISIDDIIAELDNK